MIEIGRNVGQGFAQGIRGSTDDIKSAFSDLNQKLTDQMVTSREIIAKEQDKLDALRKAKKPDADAIREAQKIIAENQDILERTTAAHNTLVTTLKSEKIELIGLTNEYERISERLKGAKTALDEARKTRDEAVRGFTDQYATLPDIIKTDAQGNVIDDQVGPYLEALKNQANAVTAYQATLQQLRKLGLDDATYQKLLKEGPADQQFANQLLAGGKTAVSSLNTLDGNLQKVSKTLAVNAGKNLYQAGVDAAAGLVRGLQSKKSDIYDEMETIARRTLAGINPNLTVVKFQTFDEQIADRFTQERMLSRLTMMFGVLALLLAAIGLYGVTAYSVVRRTQEIGIRMALGADRAGVVAMILRGAMVQAVVGLAIGVPVALVCVRFVKSQLYEVTKVDAGVLLAALGVLGLAAAVAGLIPAKRAASIHPMEALRTE